jgi:hypothetical protein
VKQPVELPGDCRRERFEPVGLVTECPVIVEDDAAETNGGESIAETTVGVSPGAKGTAGKKNG